MLRDRDSDPSKAGISEYLSWADLLSMSSEPTPGGGFQAAAGKWDIGSCFLHLASVNAEGAGDTWLLLQRGPAGEQAFSTVTQS